MAVTIDEMQIDVKSGAKNAQAQEPAAAPPKESIDLSKQMSMLAERAQRLTTD